MSDGVGPETRARIHDCLERAAERVGESWPLHSFVTANPLAGFEDRPFPAAVRAGERVFGGRGYPDAAVFRQAWADGRIDPDRLSAALTAHGYGDDPEQSLDRIGDEQTASSDEREATVGDRVDGVVTKWLAAFFDEGQADWSLPERERGFYDATRRVAAHDRTLPDRSVIVGLPEDPVAAVAGFLEEYPRERWARIVETHLAALPGWTGLVVHRIKTDGEWQSTHPVTLGGYLAVRLAVTVSFGAAIDHGGEAVDDVGGAGTGEEGVGETTVPLEEPWLAAWEATYREELVDAVAAAGRAGDEGGSADAGDGESAGTGDSGTAGTSDGGSVNSSVGGDARPDAQFVFCIDTRSEIVRRHVEAAGDYETHGYAGFFGIPMRYEGYGTGVAVDACPPILDARHRVRDRPTAEHGAEGDGRQATHDWWHGLERAVGELVHTLRGNPGTAFGFVETTGSGYGLGLAARTLLPDRVYDAVTAVDDRVPDSHEFCEPTTDHEPTATGELPVGLTLDEKVEYAATAFDLLGWETFARVVAFVGHASQTTNNPFEASLDCGACAGNPGGPSARLLASICNESAVRERLRDRGHEVPTDTVFVAGEHNTTTDEITLYEGGVPASHAEDLDRLQADLATAQAGAASERVGDMDTRGEGTDTAVGPAAGVRETRRRAADWAETRPEWGLAGNAAFVIGRRSLTAGLDLDGRVFLHSYDPETDPDGEALAAIVSGPLVVTQWINSQYYFASVDNAVYGSGSKVTQNPVGNVGVYQGNGGDLMTGLPAQSLTVAADEPYHQPLRLSVVVESPVGRTTDVVADHDHVRGLLDDRWLSLTVVDPEQGYESFHYAGGLSWTDDAGEPATVGVDPDETATVGRFSED
ncbi:MAG: hypothetical protein J07HB67_00192 [halophilic archaeon J07HB67]|jgi:Uncharacterized protein conserved in bacteria|nr:MAG: hypothetical protein J07HB67_00192 [halophilic archaeon J07HB67]